MLRIDNLTISYDSHIVFRGLTQSFQPGCIALCEEESTGKSALLKAVAGAILPATGDVLIDGYSLTEDPAQARARLAYIPADCLISPQQTGREFLARCAVQKHATVDASVLDWAHRLDLDAHLDKRFEQMSTGTRRKVYLVAALIGNPAVIVADGPTDGVDARSCAVLVDLFKAWANDKVVLFASHDAPFVQACQARQFDIATPQT